jgi:hypothetical protein
MERTIRINKREFLLVKESSSVDEIKKLAKSLIEDGFCVRTRVYSKTAAVYKRG